MSQLRSQVENEFSLSPPFCSVQALSGLDDAHAHWGGQSALVSLADSNVNLIQKYSHRHIQK